MRIEIDDSTSTMLTTLKNCLLLTNNKKLLLIKDFTIYEQEEKYLFGGTKTVKYVTALEILNYRSQGKIISRVDDEEVLHYLRNLDFYEMRNNWLMIKEQFKAFDIKIKDIEY